MKVFENILNQKISAQFENIISKQQTGFHGGFDAQYSLLVMLETFRKTLRKGGDYAALLTDRYVKGIWLHTSWFNHWESISYC